MDKTVNTKVEIVDNEFAKEKVKGNKQNFWQLLVVMVGFTFFSPSMTSGGNLGLGLNFKNFAIAVILGNLFLAFYTGALAHIGQNTGMNLDLLARKSFGDRGSHLPSLLVGLTQLGWFGVGVAMFAIPVSNLYGINAYMLVIIVGLAMTITSMIGNYYIYDRNKGTCSFWLHCGAINSSVGNIFSLYFYSNRRRSRKCISRKPC